MTRASQDLAAEIQRVKSEQFAFAVQWRKLREHAESRGVSGCWAICLSM